MCTTEYGFIEISSTGNNGPAPQTASPCSISAEDRRLANNHTG